MSQVTVIKEINAPVELVFQTISDIRNFSKAVPDIVDVEFLTDQKTGVGTRFRETRVMYGKEATEELEVTELVENDRIRIMADSHGVVWDSLFSVKENGDATELTLVMDMRPHKLMAKIMTFVMKRSMRKALEKDMDAVKEYCEG
ncbi:SRPBCC family protein [Aliifodinibius sp. S!AR15-10]|uniref:SRPBCC family protein n=1 Tax=Aliifodinibius sp. S!AR15-10 TaxID=2950437 RepID=UPI00285EBDB4|nr:SRPBCC family protein [Aliifodinibius sp. S!AR15-10]MDR8390088.1 SRPBCC family protein [Aliifodinibius sp. S!AR15-10]